MLVVAGGVFVCGWVAGGARWLSVGGLLCARFRRSTRIPCMSGTGRGSSRDEEARRGKMKLPRGTRVSWYGYFWVAHSGSGTHLAGVDETIRIDNVNR